MTDYRRDAVFVAAEQGLHVSIQVLARRGIPDALALVGRRAGVNNLQGHYNSVVPLALWFARSYAGHLASLRRVTNARRDMSRGSGEGRDRSLWGPIRADLVSLLGRRGGDVIAEEMRSGRAQTAQDVADTYLSTRFGGRHTSGGAGDTVFKRTLKMLAHLSQG